MVRPHFGSCLDPSRPNCPYCHDTGWVACRSRDGQYAFAGPVPDDAKGYFDADCWYCDSGRPPQEDEGPAEEEGFGYPPIRGTDL